MRPRKSLGPRGKSFWGRINFKDGLISGLIGVAGSDGEINAGMSGEGNANNAVRFWAGANAANRANAPWRVEHGGTVYMDKAEIGGSSTIRGFLYNKRISLNKDNWGNFMFKNEFGINYFNIRSFGGNIFFEDDTALQNGNILLPFGIFKESDINQNFFDVIGESIDFIEKIIIIKRKSTTTKPFTIRGSVSISDANLFTLFAKCVLFTNSSKKECIGFLPMRGYDKDGNVIPEYSLA